MIMNNNHCYSICLSGNYFNLSTNLCDTCHDDCATCSGPSNIECLSCTTKKSDSTIYYYFKVIEKTDGVFEYTCLDDCGEGYTADV